MSAKIGLDKSPHILYTVGVDRAAGFLFRALYGTAGKPALIHNRRVPLFFGGRENKKMKTEKKPSHMSKNASTATALGANTDAARTKSSFTPGPWTTLKGCQSTQVNTVKTHHVNALTLSGADVSGEHVDIIARVMAGPGLSEGSGEANARLIAAAPELLNAARIAEKFYVEELKEIGGCDHHVNICVCHIVKELDDLRAAIAKAEGKKVR